MDKEWMAGVIRRCLWESEFQEGLETVYVMHDKVLIKFRNGIEFSVTVNQMTGPPIYEPEQRDGAPVEVPEAVGRGLERIRRDGAVNMFDRTGVIAVAMLLELWDVAEFIESDPSRYGRLVINGAVVEGTGQRLQELEL